ncbi:hypothetical protein N7X57_12175 [Lactiplantibacillus paraplantarum]|uniref:hypothetical protein n=1 Tax=Lactiplantibacillus paraplantarum TaxID=60520 RepID=UPI0007E4758F|nr:hypothetical protein [Lactiplantibacillus paraplantarum]MCW1911178.1 hypothetical protein [Lactiplantibacillus paraplantarum]OAX76044.1 hypothetical protein A0U96_13125 [Lactiplantibacillus plantarum]
MYLSKKALTSSLALTSLLGVSMLTAPVKASAMTTQASTQITAFEQQTGVLRTDGIAGNLSAVYSDSDGATIVRWLPGGQDYRYDRVVHNGFTGLTYYRIATNEWIDSSNVQLIN